MLYFRLSLGRCRSVPTPASSATCDSSTWAGTSSSPFPSTSTDLGSWSPSRLRTTLSWWGCLASKTSLCLCWLLFHYTEALLREQSLAWFSAVCLGWLTNVKAPEKLKLAKNHYDPHLAISEVILIFNSCELKIKDYFEVGLEPFITRSACFRSIHLPDV